MPDVRIPTVDPSPAEDGVLAGAFQPRGKSSFLTAMLRTLSAGSRALMYYGPGSLPHRIIEALSIELSQLSFDLRRLSVRAVREAGYRAFRDDVLFPTRFGASFCAGLVQVSVPLQPFTRDTVIAAGDLMGTGTGLTARVLENTTLKAGEMSVLVPVASEVVGRAGYIPAGAITTYLQNSALRVTNPAAITGGEDEETDAALHARMQAYVQGIQTSSGRSVLSAAAQANVAGLRVSRAALIRPWRIPGLNREMGYGYVVLDTGSGSAPQALLDDAQARIDVIVAAAQDVKSISCNPFAVAMTLSVECRRDADLQAVERGLRTAWAAAFISTAIEDGTGRGTLRLIDLKTPLDAVGGVLTITFPDVESGLITVPVAARAVEGVLTLNLYRGV